MNFLRKSSKRHGKLGACCCSAPSFGLREPIDLGVTDTVDLRRSGSEAESTEDYENLTLIFRVLQAVIGILVVPLGSFGAVASAKCQAIYT